MTIAEKIIRAKEDLDLAFNTGVSRGYTDACANLFERSATEVIVPEGVKIIEYYVFYGYARLIKVSLPSTLTKIYGAAFRGCSSLENIVIPENVSEIWNEAFYKCAKLTEMIFPQKIKKVSIMVLAECTRLTSFVAKGNVTSIEERAFDRCSNCLSYDFSCCDSVPSLGTNAFRDINAQAEIIVPASLLSQWKTQWASLASHIRAKSE